MTHLVYLRLFRWLVHFGPATSAAIAEGLGAKKNDISTRVCYLAELGLVEALGRHKPVSFRVTTLGTGVYQNMRQRVALSKELHP